jgi:predicted phosphate transport protein (TIGR00153 family)
VIEMKLKKMKLKLKKDKKSELLNAASKFYTEVLDGSLLLHECINDLVSGKLVKKKLDEVIECEHKADIAKEEYINVLYKDKRALPFLIEDRYRIIKYLDTISDNSEELARGLRVFPFVLFDDIKEDMKEINDLYQKTIDSLVDMVNLMETDFKTAYDKSFHVETLKRKARKEKYKILETLYQKPEEKSLRVYLTSKICIKIFDMIVTAEEISDFLRSLIVKYPSK